MKKRSPGSLHMSIQMCIRDRYATAPDYVSTIMSIINKYNLTKYDCLTLRKGSSGSVVKELQILLIKAGYSCGKYGSDGKFGDSTLEAVKAFQADRGLAVDGVVGTKTWEELYKG